MVGRHLTMSQFCDTYWLKIGNFELKLQVLHSKSNRISFLFYQCHFVQNTGAFTNSCEILEKETIHVNKKKINDLYFYLSITKKRQIYFIYQEDECGEDEIELVVQGRTIGVR